MNMYCRNSVDSINQTMQIRTVDNFFTLPTDSFFLRSRFFEMRGVLIGHEGRYAATKSIVNELYQVIQTAVVRPIFSPLANRIQKFFLFAFGWFVNATILFALITFLILAIPEVYYRLYPVEVKPVLSRQEGSPLGGAFEQGSQFRNQLLQVFAYGAGENSNLLQNGSLTNQERVSNESAANQNQDQLVDVLDRYIPDKDETLPEGDWIIIPRIGVRTQFEDSEDPEAAMSTGVWKAPDYGLPGQLTMPMIMAAHRFGWDWWWQSEYWRYNSFYLLPDTEPGDRVEIISDQRKWVYEIYAGEEGVEITDYDADLILYTCKFLTSPIRHFRYARLIDHTANSQKLE